MDALDLLLHRRSCPRLTTPGPTPAQWERIQRAALTAPDHARLRPWRFLTVEGSAREALGELFVDAARADNPDLDADEAARLRSHPLRAPLLVVATATYTAHPKVPLLEQQLSAGCAAHAMVQAAWAQGLGAIWRTGPLAFNRHVHRGLGLADDDTLIGFLYLGTPAAEPPERSAPDPADFFEAWSGPAD